MMMVIILLLISNYSNNSHYSNRVKIKSAYYIIVYIIYIIYKVKGNLSLLPETLTPVHRD